MISKMSLYLIKKYSFYEYILLDGIVSIIKFKQRLKELKFPLFIYKKNALQNKHRYYHYVHSLNLNFKIAQFKYQKKKNL